MITPPSGMIHWSINARFLAGGTALRDAYYGQGSGPILLDELACTGTERMLINCTNDGLGVHNCVHDEDAGARCVGE